MASAFQREYLIQLPLPLAQLYNRAHNANSSVPAPSSLTGRKSN